MALVDLAEMQNKCRAGQWSLADIDWDAPGRERVSAEQRERMRSFMGDLVWIESFGQYAFEAMAATTDEPALRAIYESFAVDELRHADAEQRLMARWGMIEPGRRPEPNPSARVAVEFLQRHGREIPFAVYAAILPMFEIALDGALLQFVTATVDDPVAHRVFEKVNRDEARHLAVDFHTLAMLGRESGFGALWTLAAALTRPSTLRMLALGYIQLLERAWTELRRMGVPATDLTACIRKFHNFGVRNPDVARHAIYRLIASHASAFSDPDNAYHWVAAALVWLTDVLAAVDSWTPAWAPVRVLPAAA